MQFLQNFNYTYCASLKLKKKLHRWTNIFVKSNKIASTTYVAGEGNPNVEQAGPFYASVATLQRDRTKGLTLNRGVKDGIIFYENPYTAMPQNKNITRYNIKKSY